MTPSPVLAAAAIAISCAVLPARAHATDYFVAPDGADDAAGTLDAPFATIERAQAAASAGDTVFIRGGEYTLSGTTDTIGVELTKSGTPDHPIRYFAYEDEVPIFDLFSLEPQARVTGIDVHASWLHLRGLEVRGVQQRIVGDSWGVRVRGDHNVLERLNVHHNQAPGIFIASGASNSVLNCDSHHNYDPLEDGGNADGFGCHSSGGDNVLRGCRAYENSDDGFDFINAPGTCTVEESWSFRNGFIPDTTMSGANGAGFKAGGFGEPPSIPMSGVPRHVVRHNVAFGNRVSGFYANHHPGGIDFFNNTAFDNPLNFDMRPTPTAPSMHTLRNNIAMMPGTAIGNFTGGGSDESNSWTLPVTVSSDDFASTDKADALAPRNADGSLSSTALMRLVDGSDLIDRGEEVGLPFAGVAPDLGAFELGLTPAAMDAGVEPDAALPMTDAGGVPPTSGGAGGAGGAGAASGAGAPSGADGMEMTPSAMAGAGAMTAQPMGAAGATTAAPSSSEQASGCGCRIAASQAPRPLTALLLGLALGLSWARLRARMYSK